MSILGIGVDLIKISRISRLLSKKGNLPQRFCRRILHPKELDVFSKLPTSRMATYVAGSWAAKEAVYKAIDIKDQQSFQFNQWYRTTEKNKPKIKFDGERADDFLLSISHDGDLLIATVLRQGNTYQ